jgi:general nucleoside transport system ATP-binding protein
LHRTIHDGHSIGSDKNSNPRAAARGLLFFSARKSRGFYILATTMASEYALDMRGITKRFPGVLANDNISLDLRRGEIHALLGENGAGKSTLMNILYGLYQPDSGEIKLNGEAVKITSPAVAIARGVGMVHQHFMLVPTLTVTENITLGLESSSGLLLDVRNPAKRIRQIAQDYGIDVDPDAYVKDLSVGEQQRVEIVKTLYRNAEILVLDEPTAVLTPLEVDELFGTLSKLTAQGKSIIFITHKLREVQAVANRITVLRQGRVVGTTQPSETDEAGLASMMVGRSVLLKIDKMPAKPGAPVLDVKALTALSDRKSRAVNAVSFTVRAGEILGVAGVEGNGQSELVEAITGLRKIESGTIEIEGQPIRHESPVAVIDAGTAHIPEDRHKFGMVASYPIKHNMVLSTFDEAPFTTGLALNDGAITENAQKLIRDFDVRTPSEVTAAGSLSGGNQQKMVVAREFSRPIKLLIAAQPTRGVDVGSIEFIHRRIVEQRDAGVGVLLISAELDEILSLSDRIIVLYKGTIVGEVDGAGASREQIGLWMMGTQGVKA